jgi:hypothetical protein
MSVEQSVENIYVVDEDYKNNLQLYHYNKCSNDSLDCIKNARGVVKSDDKIVSKSFGYIDECTVDGENVSELIENNKQILDKIHSFHQSKIYTMYEGTVVRMFFWKHKWFLSTHKKLNAFDSKWGNSECKTFGEMFVDSLCDPLVNNSITSSDEVLDIFNNFCFQLDTNKTYVFLIIHDDLTSMICKRSNKIPPCLHIGEFDNKTNLLVEGNTSGLPSLPQLSFNTVFDLIEYVRKLNHLEHPGVIIYFPNQTQLKIYNHNYKKAQELRGNQPDLLYRYLEVRKNNDLSNRFLELYKEQEDYLISSELAILDVSKKLFHLYMRRYIQKQYVFVPKCEFMVMQMCHQWHNENRDLNKISLNKVLEILENLPIKMLYSIVKNYL